MNYPDLFLFVAGHWRDREGRDGRPVINPATGSAVAELPLATAADLDEACAARGGRIPGVAGNPGL